MALVSTAKDASIALSPLFNVQIVMKIWLQACSETAFLWVVMTSLSLLKELRLVTQHYLVST